MSQVPSLESLSTSMTSNVMFFVCLYIDINKDDRNCLAFQLMITTDTSHTYDFEYIFTVGSRSNERNRIQYLSWADLKSRALPLNRPFHKAHVEDEKSFTLLLFVSITRLFTTTTINEKTNT